MRVLAALRTYLLERPVRWMIRRETARTPLVWESAGTDEPGDQNADLPGTRFYASVGPDGPTTWSWEIRDLDDANHASVAGSRAAPSEDAAKAAVDQWRRETGRHQGAA